MAGAADRRPVDPDEIEGLFRDHYEELFGYLVRLTGDPDQAADGAQEAFKRMLQSPPSGESVKSWLYRVATNLVRERARTRARRHRLLEERRAAVLPERSRTPDEELTRRRTVRAVRAALDELPERDRLILLMREEGFTHREIAEAVGTTTGSVGTMVARALDRFAGALWSGGTGSADLRPGEER